MVIRKKIISLLKIDLESVFNYLWTKSLSPMTIFRSHRTNNRSRMLGPFFRSMNVIRSGIYRTRGGKEAGYPKRVREYDTKILPHTNLTKYCEKPRRQTTPALCDSRGARNGIILFCARFKSYRKIHYGVLENSLPSNSSRKHLFEIKRIIRIYYLFKA